MFRAGHAHAGVLVILSLVHQLLADAAYPAPGSAFWVARLGVPLAAVLVPMGFFLSMASPRSHGAQRLDLSDMAWRSRAWLVSAVVRCVAHPFGASLRPLTDSIDAR
jgi:hypothetical protein